VIGYARGVGSPGETIAALGEDAIIELFARGGPPPDTAVLVSNGDDACAYRPTTGRAQVLTTDGLTEGTHFVRGTTPARAVGRKLMAVNLSDLAAMGAHPRYALISAILPRDLPLAWLREVTAGIHEAAAAHDVVILGGNVARSDGALVLDATLVGDAEPDRLVRRSGARPGDDLWVSGRLGGPAAALARVVASGAPGPEDPEHELFRELVDPVARVGLGGALAAAGLPRAMCDVSDGLARDLGHLLADGLGCRIRAGALPASPALFDLARRFGAEPLRWIVGGGEEYELLFAARADARSAIVQVASSAGCSVSRIGEVTEPGPRELEHEDGRLEPVVGGFDHFSGESTDAT